MQHVGRGGTKNYFHGAKNFEGSKLKINICYKKVKNKYNNLCFSSN